MIYSNVLILLLLIASRDDRITSSQPIKIRKIKEKHNFFFVQTASSIFTLNVECHGGVDKIEPDGRQGRLVQSGQLVAGQVQVVQLGQAGKRTIPHDLKSVHAQVQPTQLRRVGEGQVAHDGQVVAPQR